MPGHDKHATPNPGAAVKQLIMKQDNKAKPDTTNQPRSCGRCEFMREVANPHAIGQHSMYCHRFPPNVTTMPTQVGGGRSGIALLTNFPLLNASMWCYEFKEKPSTDREGLENPP